MTTTPQPEGNQMPNKDWEYQEEFDSQKGGFTVYNTQSGSRFLNEDQLIYFIKSLLTSHESQVRDEIVKKCLEKIIEIKSQCDKENKEYTDEYNMTIESYNKALSDVEQKLKDLLITPPQGETK
jgi:hypothetical protein